MRYERKYRIEDKSFEAIREMTRDIPLSFRTLYPDRFVNNIYLDTTDLTFLRENLIGAGQRTKYRIRWYGENPLDIQQPVLEAKIKDGELGTKEYAVLPEFSLKDYPSLASFVRKNISSNLVLKSEGVKENAGGILQQKPFVIPDIPLKPVLLNTYLRSYLISYDRRFRLTIDRKMRFSSLETGHFDRLKWYEDDAIVVEVKYEMEDHLHWDRVGQFIPFRLNKNSKYVNGMLLGGFA